MTNLILLLAGMDGIANATDYYVSLTGDNADNGTTEGSAWRTITYAAAADQAQAGDTVYIKGGNYGHEHVVISNSGTEGSPIIFEGYDGTPVIDGQDRTGTGIYASSKDHIKIKNIRLALYEYGIRLWESEYVTLDNIVATNFGTTGYNGWGIFLRYSHHCNILNCNVTDARAVNFQIWQSHYNLIENCTSYGIETDNAVDYYIGICYGHDNTIRNCITHNMHPEASAGHGIGIKDDYHDGYYDEHSYNNKVIDCEAYGHGENLYAAHNSHHNEFINCSVYGEFSISGREWSEGLTVRDGSYDNTFKNCKVTDVKRAVEFVDTSESPGATTQRNNNFLNCIFYTIDTSIIRFNNVNCNTTDNAFKNCVFIGANRLFYTYALDNERNNIIINSIILDISSWGTGSPIITYSDFWNNGFIAPSGTGNIEQDPLFANPANDDFHLKSEHGRWNGSTWVTDAQTSPCIDTGDPTFNYSAEFDYPSGHINMGAYGNTTEASWGTPVKTYNISGYVEYTNNTGIYNASVSNNATSAENYTNTNGLYLLTNLENGTFNVTASKTGLISNSTIRTITGADVTNANITLAVEYSSNFYFNTTSEITITISGTGNYISSRAITDDDEETIFFSMDVKTT